MVSQRRAGRQLRFQVGQAVRSRDHQSRARVPQDVTNLRGLEQRVDRNENSPRSGRAEQCRNRLQALLKINRDTVAAIQTQSQHGLRNHVDVVCQLGVAYPALPVYQGFLVGKSVGGVENKLLYEVCHYEDLLF